MGVVLYRKKFFFFKLFLPTPRNIFISLNNSTPHLKTFVTVTRIYENDTEEKKNPIRFSKKWETRERERQKISINKNAKRCGENSSDIRSVTGHQPTLLIKRAYH